jgi:hypothetical protein
MKRQIAGLHAADRCALTKSPMDFFWFGCRESSFADKHRSLITLLF